MSEANTGDAGVRVTKEAGIARVTAVNNRPFTGDVRSRPSARRPKPLTQEAAAGD